MRFDIGWRALTAAFWFCVKPIRRNRALKQVRQSWSDDDECIVTLSVRSAFDLLLQEFRFEKGDEVLMSAWTVPGMIQIVKAHGLVPVPVDVDQRGHLIRRSFERSISARSRMLVVAHLFGGRAPLDAIVPTLKRHNILLVEDCAQSFDQVGDKGHPVSDAVMHSFGPIKTSTALGGGIVRVRSQSLRDAMQQRLRQFPVQSRLHFAKRVIRFAFLKMLSGKIASQLLYGFLDRVSIDVDAMVNSLGRGFNGDRLMKQIRFQPSTPLLQLMKLRFDTFDGRSIQRRKMLGRLFDQSVGRSDRSLPDDSRWTCPIFVDNRETVCQRLRSQGFDATARSRMTVVPAPDHRRVPRMATGNWNRIVFLPWYAGLSRSAVCQMAQLVGVELKHHVDESEFPSGRHGFIGHFDLQCDREQHCNREFVADKTGSLGHNAGLDYPCSLTEDL